MANNSGKDRLDSLVNAANRVRAWQITALAMMAINAWMGVQMVRMANAAPTRLVPYEFAANNNYVQVDPEGMNAAEYLVFIAEADLKNYTDWQNRTISNQYARFMNRMGPQLYQAKNIELKKELEQLSRIPYSQKFYPTQRQVIDRRVVSISGTLERYAGERKVLEARVTYTLSYEFTGGLPYIRDWEVNELTRRTVS